MIRILRLLSLVVLLIATGFAGTPGAVQAGGGGHGCMKPPFEAAGVTVTIDDSCFGPALLVVQPGTTVTFENQDVMPHNVVSSGQVRLISETDLQPGAKASILVERQGLLLYYCALHPSMAGVIVADYDATRATLAAPAVASPYQVDPHKLALPPVREVKVEESSGLPAGTVAGIVVVVGLVSAGGGFALRRRG